MSELQEILKTMTVPAMRTDLTRPANLRWLMRNLAAYNSDHEDLALAFSLIRDLMKKV